MHFKGLSLLCIALATTALGYTNPDPGFDSIFQPAVDEKINAGSTYTVKWTVPATAASGPVTITLIGGADDAHLNPLVDLAKGYDNAKGSFTWAVDKALGSMTVYGLQITNEGNTTAYQYSNRFHIVAASSGTTSSSATSTAPTKTGTTSLSATISPKSSVKSMGGCPPITIASSSVTSATPTTTTRSAGGSTNMGSQAGIAVGLLLMGAAAL